MAVFKLKDGSWGYRVLVKDQDGVSRNRRATRDKLGNKFKTKREATNAMNQVIREFEKTTPTKIVHSNVTVREVFEEYCRYGRSDKAFGTIRKQDSMWNIHIKKDFGDRFIKDITVAEVNNYLSDLYYLDGYSYAFVESFLKFFYLIFGQAHSREYMDSEKYNKMCVDKNVRIRMPKLKIDEDLEIKTFDKEELKQLDEYFRGTNIETAYMLGRYCGLRKGETLGLTWDCVDFDNDCIRIEKQMQIQDGLIKIVPLKTRCARRQVIMNDVLKNYLLTVFKKRELDKVLYKDVRKQREVLLKTKDGSEVSSLDLVNTLSNGKLQTETVFKFHAQKIKQTLKIEFKYHYLRHTFGTMMALQNTPQFLLCGQMGHSNINVTGKYYLGESKDSYSIIKNCVNLL